MTPDDERDYKATLALIASLERQIMQLTLRVNELGTNKVPQPQCTLRHQEAEKRAEVRDESVQFQIQQIKEVAETRQGQIAETLKQYVPKSSFAVGLSVLLGLSIFIALLVNAIKLPSP